MAVAQGSEVRRGAPAGRDRSAIEEVRADPADLAAVAEAAGGISRTEEQGAADDRFADPLAGIARQLHRQTPAGVMRRIVGMGVEELAALRDHAANRRCEAARTDPVHHDLSNGELARAGLIACLMDDDLGEAGELGVRSGLGGGGGGGAVVFVGDYRSRHYRLGLLLDDS